MPYENVKEALEKHPNLKKYSAKARRGWVKSFNSAMESENDESYAFAVAYSVANKIDNKENINDKSKAASTKLHFVSEKEALQYLSNFTNKRVIIAKELNVSKFLSMIDKFTDDLKETFKQYLNNSKDKNLVALLKLMIEETEKYKQEMEDLIARYRQSTS